MNEIQPFVGFKFDFSKRDVACFIFALSVHSLLLLWKGGLMDFETKPGGGLGDVLVNVEFQSSVPDYNPAGGGSSPKPEGILARMKSLIHGNKGGKKADAIAMGVQQPAVIEAPKQNWNKADVLTPKKFEKNGFEGLVNKKDALDVARGQTQQVVVQPSAGNFKQSPANLKENKFMLAKKDVPFKIVSPKSSDELVNVNAIAVNVGAKTTSNVKSLDGGPGSGAALQSKTFATKGSSSSGGFGSPAGSKIGGSSGAGLAMGSGISSGAGGPAAAGSGSGEGGGWVGTGNGTGTGKGNGFGSGTGTGRSYGGGGGFGSGSGMSTLARNTVPAETVSSGKKSAYNSGFNITGALANRPILSKALAVYEMDCRVGLRFRVDWSGKVLDGILIAISSGSPTFDQKVVAVLQQWVFSKLPPNRSNEIQEGLITFVFKGV